MYIKRFTTLAQYKASKADTSTSGAIGKILSSTSEMSCVVMSYISGDGGIQTIVDSVNSIVETKHLQVGDIVVYNATASKFMGAKGGKFNANSVGGCVLDKSRFTSAKGWKVVGWVVERIGNKCWLASEDDLSTYQMCSNDSTTIPGIYTDSGVMKGNGSSNWIASGSMELAEEIYGTSRYQYTWPITRTEWNAAADNSSITGADSVTINKADYNNDFDCYYRHVVLVRYPLAHKSTTGSHYGYALADENGRHNTKCLLAAVTSSFTCPGATACNNYSVAGVSGFTNGNWYMPALAQMWRMMRYYKRLVACGMPFQTRSWYWSSTQYSVANAWLVGFGYASVSNGGRTLSAWVRPFADFQIN